MKDYRLTLYLVLLALFFAAFTGCAENKRSKILNPDLNMIKQTDTGWILEEETKSFGAYTLLFKNIKTKRRSLITVSTIKSKDEIGKTEVISIIATLKLKGYSGFKDIETKFLGRKAYMIQAVKKDKELEMVMYSFKEEGFLMSIVTFSSQKNMSDKTELESLYLMIRNN